MRYVGYSCSDAGVVGSQGMNSGARDVQPSDSSAGAKFGAQIPRLHRYCQHCLVAAWTGTTISITHISLEYLFCLGISPPRVSNYSMYSASDLFGYPSYFPGFNPDEHGQIEGLPVSSGRPPNRLKIVTVAEEPEDTPNPDDESNESGEMLSMDHKKTRRLSAQYDMGHGPLSMSSSFSQGDFALSMSPAASFLLAFSPSLDSPVPRQPDDEGEVVSGYTLGPVVGYGGFSTIRRASSPSGGTVAVKIVRRADLSKQDNPAQERRRLDHEAAVWSSLSHEHILPLFAAVHTAYADFFITLYCPSGSLFDILKRDGRPALPQDDTGMMFRQVVRGLRYLHEVAELVHRDIKLENVLLDETGVCRIGDFGMSRKIGELDEEEEQYEAEEDKERMQPHQGDRSVPTAQSKRSKTTGLHLHPSLVRPSRYRHSMPANSSTETTPPRTHAFQPGSLPYTAPELLMPQTSTTPLTPQPAQDIWALGVLLYTLLTGQLPFVDAFEPRLQIKIVVGKPIYLNIRYLTFVKSQLIYRRRV
jgi:serine/threonine protein kinase